MLLGVAIRREGEAFRLRCILALSYVEIPPLSSTLTLVLHLLLHGTKSIILSNEVTRRSTNAVQTFPCPPIKFLAPVRMSEANGDYTSCFWMQRGRGFHATMRLGSVVRRSPHYLAHPHSHSTFTFTHSVMELDPIV